MSLHRKKSDANEKDTYGNSCKRMYNIDIVNVQCTVYTHPLRVQIYLFYEKKRKSIDVHLYIYIWVIHKRNEIKDENAISTVEDSQDSPEGV
jgi:hypothetical protein